MDHSLKVPNSNNPVQVQYPVMAIQVVTKGMLITTKYSDFHLEQVLVPTENCINFCAEFIPSLPHGIQQDLLVRIRDTNKTNADIARAIQPVLKGV